MLHLDSKGFVHIKFMNLAYIYAVNFDSAFIQACH
nr:MAG TPA: hypothetical protein [Bacteriophage sp.]